MIELKNLSYLYDSFGEKEKYALLDINLKINKGEYVCIIGHTGCGKTTLLKHLSCSLKPTSGKIYINGLDVWEQKKDVLKKISREIGFVFQNPSYQLFEETVEKDIAFGPKNFGFSDDEIYKRVKKVCEIVGIGEDILKKSPFELSGGQKRRVAIAGIIATTPNILLLDEPTAGLDPAAKKRMLKIIKNYNEEFKATVVVVTHSMQDAFLFADRIVVLDGGKIFSCSSVCDTFKKVKDLQRMGLDIPDITKVFVALNEKGYFVPKEVYSVEQAFEILKNMIKGNVK